jgi:hypothetical protein
MIVRTDQYMGRLLVLKQDGDNFQVVILESATKGFIAETKIHTEADAALGDARRQVDALRSAQ